MQLSLLAPVSDDLFERYTFLEKLFSFEFVFMPNSTRKVGGSCSVQFMFPFLEIVWKQTSKGYKLRKYISFSQHEFITSFL